MTKAVFYHAGCAICTDAEQFVRSFLDKTKAELDIVHLGMQREYIAEAEKAGVKSVPALVVDGHVYHINFGASMDDVKKGS